MSNEFFVLHRSSLLNQLGNLIEVWPGRVVPFRFHLFQKDHPSKINDSSHGFSCCWLPSMGSSVFFQMQRPFLIAHVVQHVNIVYSFSKFAHAAVSNTVRQHRSARVGIIHELRSALSRMFHQRRGASFIPYAAVFNRAAMDGGWKLAHNITVHITRLSLQKSCSEINVKQSPSSAGCHLTAHSNPGLVEAGESVCKYSFCLSWKPLHTHLAFALRMLSCLAVLIVGTHRPVT